MGSRAHVIVAGGPEGLAEVAAARIEQLESLWSRFRPGSDTTRLNLHAGARVNVAPETVELVERAVEGWRLTAGAFDPTLLGPVIRAGYDRTFDLVPGPGAARPERCPARLRRRRDGAGLGAAAGRERIRPGWDRKGLAADIVAAELLDAGARGVCVNLGGDLRVAGEGPAGDTWTVAVEHPGSPEPIARLGLADGAVATSTTLRRRWRVGGEPRHHLIDPRTGAPSATGVDLAAVVAGQAWLAEVLAKAVLMAGWRGASAVLAGTGAEALTVASGGRIHATPGLSAFLGGATPAAALIS